MNTIFIVLPILTVLMFDLGLTLKPQDFKLFMYRPMPIMAGLIGQIVMLPLIAWCICNAFNIPPLFAIGIMLIACSPGGSSSNVFSMLAGGDVALSVSLTALSSVITLFTIPALMGVVTQAVGNTTQVELPVMNLLMQNIVLMAVPIVLGLLLAMVRPATAERLHGVLKRLAFPALVVLVTIFFVQHRVTIVSSIATLGGAVTILILATMGCGAVLAWIMKLTERERRTIVIEVGMQNAAQAITIACSPFVFNNETIAVPAIIYALMMNVVLLGYVGVIRRAEGRGKS